MSNGSASGGDDDLATGNDASAENVYASDSVVGFTARSRSRSRLSDVPFTIGQVFRRGDVPSQRTLVATIDGQRIPTQVDEKATWPDGSLRHAVVSVRLPSMAAGASKSVVLNTDKAAASQPNATLSELLGTDFDASVEINKDGRRYPVSARDVLTQALQSGSCSTWGKTCKRWLSGPLVSEWIVGGPLAAGGQTDPHLAVYFHVRAYADGRGTITNARVDTVIENNWAYAADPQNQRYDAQIHVGRHDFKVNNLKHYRQARWHKVLWWQDPPEVYARLDGDYLQATKAISRYAKLNPSSGFLNSKPASYPPMNKGATPTRMGQTGAAPNIGPLPQWTSTYVVSMDQRAQSWMLANDSALGSYSFHFRDEKTGRPLEITDHPYVTIANRSYATTVGGGYYRDLLPGCKGDCDSPLRFDISHHPSIGYVSYLVTGDYYYLEEMQFTASYIELWANPAYRDFKKGVLTNGPRGDAQRQVRGQAWALRSMADAAFATPDSDPMKSYFMTMINNILASYNATYTDQHDGTNPLHVLNRGGAVIYPPGDAVNRGIATWQAAFFTWAAGHAAEQGFDGAKKLLDWLSVFQVGVMTDSQQSDDGFCWLQASAYYLLIRDGNTDRSPMYRDLATVFKNTRPDLAGLACNSQPMVNQMTASSNPRHQYRIGEMHGYASSATGFPSNFQIGLAMATDSGIDNAQQAWQIFEARRVKPSYQNYPNFAVVPRN